MQSDIDVRYVSMLAMKFLFIGGEDLLPTIVNNYLKYFFTCIQSSELT